MKLSHATRSVQTLTRLSLRHNAITQMHPLSKVIVTGFFIVAVTSCSRYDPAAVLPFFLYPTLLIALYDIPLRPFAKPIAAALVFAALAGGANLFFDTQAAFTLGTLSLSRGMLTLFSLLLKATLTVLSALLLCATTPMSDLLCALRMLKIPQVALHAFQLTFRYLSVIGEEVQTLQDAYRLRATGRKGVLLRDAGPFLGRLLLRSYRRALRISDCMSLRGGNVDPADASCRPAFRPADVLYPCAMCAAFLLLRLLGLPLLLGRLLGGLF